MRSTTTPGHRRATAAGFTLLELLIVVAVIGLIAAMAAVAFQRAKNKAHQSAFIAATKTFAQASLDYIADTGEYLEDANSGTLPRGWEPYVNKTDWENGTPIGGIWDYEKNSYGIRSGFGVHFRSDHPPTRDPEFMREIDAELDDGDLTTGRFRQLDSERYYYIID